MTSEQHITEALDRFGSKHASLASILPQVALPALGTYLGGRYGGPKGQLLGGIAGGVGGQVLREMRERSQQTPATYAMDPTMDDIPPWALASAQMLQPSMKQGGHFGHLGDILGGDLGGSAYPVFQGMRQGHSAGQIGKSVLGQGVGTIGGGLAGHGVGALLNHLAGKQVMVPGLNIPVSTLLAGLGATIGNVKGLEFTAPRG